MKTKKSVGNSGLNKKIEKVNKKLDMIIVILLAKSGFTRKEVADVLKVSEKTIERMLPFEKLKKRREE
ncbi:MAG: helix-turn-helix domain-containing protein [Candidatus Bathyarchaeia archaeon]